MQYNTMYVCELQDDNEERATGTDRPDGRQV